LIQERIAASPRSVPAELGITRLPKHVGLIPDGNRRWAKAQGLHPGDGYAEGVKRGIEMLDECIDLGIEEVSVYGFTTDNTKRPADQKEKFQTACAEFAAAAMKRDVSLMVLGDSESVAFPRELRDYANRRLGEGKLKINLLVNYGWNWDLQTAVTRSAATGARRSEFTSLLGSAGVSRIDLIVRWGGCRRLSGFLPVQSVYADFYVIDDLWPDFQVEQFYDALRWYSAQDQTLGG
jgi:undecaprenyl diphosphate synthase